MGGKYEIRFMINKDNYATEYTNNFFYFMFLRFTKKLVYYKVYYFEK